MNQSSDFLTYDADLMRRALELAHQGRFTVSPNPRVGCVIAKFNPTPDSPPIILGEGYHQRKGLPHAEREALSSCLENPSEATMYVTLEPCCHHGTTPPCTDAILEAGIKRVVVATLDPFPQVAGKGVDILRKQGVEVLVGLLEDEARYENRFFIHRHQTNLPWIILKTAMSLDGKCATSTGLSKWITAETARAHVHDVRAEVDAILTGIGTITADDPSLTSRPLNLSRDTYLPTTRIILDPRLSIPSNARVLQTIDETPVWIFCHQIKDEEKHKTLSAMGAEVFQVNGDAHHLVLDQVLTILAEKNILGVLIEGGPTIHTAFLEKRLVNELMIYIAPKLIGGNLAPTFYMGQGVATMNDAPILEKVERHLLGDDTLIQGILSWRLKR